MSVRRIVVGTDGSAGAARALRWCASLAAGLAAEVVVVHAYSPLAALEGAPGTDLGALAEQARARLHDEWCAPLRDAGVTFRSLLVEDLPVEALVTTARLEDADLVVIGSHGETGWRERILGRVASELPGRVGCPVTIVPRPDPTA